MDHAAGYAFVLLVLAFWLVPVGISFAKGHVIGGVLGILAFTPVAIVTSAMIAKPDSPWARRLYGPEKLAKARRRHPE